MRITIHQPEHMPWLGLFNKICMAEVLVILDNVQYRRQYFQNRNKIKTRNGWEWVTVPLKKENRGDLLIKDVRIFTEDIRWKKKNLLKIYHSYCNTRYFNAYKEEFESVYNKGCEHLLDMNMNLIKFFLEKLGIEKKIVLASGLNAEGSKSDLIFNICKELRADVYVSGISGKDYLDLKRFGENSIDVVIQEFHHPIYNQLYEPFVPCMSVLDLLFNYGEDSLDVINGKATPVMKEVFL